MTPHIAGQGGSDQKDRLRGLFLENISRYVAGRTLLNRVTIDGDVILDADANDGVASA